MAHGKGVALDIIQEADEGLSFTAFLASFDAKYFCITFWTFASCVNYIHAPPT